MSTTSSFLEPNNQNPDIHSDVISASSFANYGPQKIDPEMITKGNNLVKPFQSSSYVDELKHQMELEETLKI